MPLPYSPPQILVYQEFNAIPAEITNPLRSWILAPNANLVRYSDEDEKELGALGAYDPNEETAYAWPEKTAGSVIDQPYTKIFIDDAKLRYFHDEIGSGLTIAPVSGKPNRIRASSGSFATVAAADRSAALYDRDVKVGDLVTVSSGDGTLDSYVRALVAEVVAAVVDDAEDGEDNQATVTATSSVEQTDGDVNRLSASVSLTNYSTYADGYTEDTYTITVTQGSTGNDITTGRYSVRTASGVVSLDDLTPAAANSKATIDDRGMSFGFNLAVSDPEDATVGADINDLILGQTWEIEVRSAHTAPSTSTGGTYTGAVDNTYTVRVIRGGKYNAGDPLDRPFVRITSAVGTDSIQSLRLDAAAQSIPLGAGGATLALSTATGLRLGDLWTVDVTAATTGRISTIVLGHDLPTAMQDDSDLELELFIQKDIEVPRYTQLPSPKTNWETSETEVTLAEDITAYDSTWTSGGEALPLTVTSGSVFVQYREWLSDLQGIYGASTPDAVLSDIPGPNHPDNPLKYHVMQAVANSNGTVVQYTSISDPDDDDQWTEALALGLERQDLYHIVFVTNRQAVFDAGVAHINALSGPAKAQYRAGFVPLYLEPVTAVVDANNSTNSAVVRATIADDSGTSGTQYTIVTQTTGNAGFLAKGVRAGDNLRVNFALDDFGGTVYEEFPVAEVISESTLRLETGPDAAVVVASQIEIWRTHTKPELVIQLGEKAANYANRRIRAVWVNGFVNGAPAVDPTIVAAACAGLLSGVVPHQHVTNIPLSGLSELVASKPYFNQEQLDQLAAYGVWIVDRDVDGVVYTRDALTTDMSSLQAKTEMVTRNLDSISYLLKSRIRQFIGRANVVPDALNQIRLRLEGGLEFLKTFSVTDSLGAQILEGTEIRAVRADVIQKDAVVIIIDLVLPFPINKISLYLNA